MQRIIHSKFIKIILIILVGIYSGYAMYTIENWLKYAALVVTIPVACLLFSYEKKITDSLLFLVVFFAILFLTMAVNLFEGITTYFLLAGLIFIAYGISRSYDFNGFVNLFLNLMTIIALLGLVGYILVNYTHVLDNLPLKANSNDVEYACGYIFFYIPIIKERNCGVFWEPGLFATFLILAIVFEAAFKNKKTSWLRIILFSITTLTTQSSAGYILLLLSFFFALAFKFNRTPNGVGKLFVSLGIFGVLFVMIFLNFIIKNTSLAENEYFSKLLFENFLEASRVKAIFHNFEVFLKNPVFGAGFQTALDSTAYVSDTSTTTYILSVFGFLGIFHLFMIILGIVRIKNMNVIAKVTLFLIIFLTINKEPHLFNLFTWIILFYFVSGVNCQKENLPLNNG